MLKKLAIVGLVIGLSGCVSEPVDPAFVGTGAIDKEEAAKTRVSLGLTYLKNGNYAQAKSNLDKAIEFAPRSGEAHYAMAYYFQQVGEADIAEEYYENALGYSRNDPDIVNSYGAFLCEQGRYEKAKDYFLKAVSARSYSATAETYENLAICSQNQNQIDEAITYFNSALNHQPTRPRSLFLLAKLYVQKQQWEEAKKMLWRYERNATVNPESLFLNYQIAQGMNDLKAAVGYGDLLKQMYPEHQHTATYVAQMGKFKPAAKVTRKLQTVEPKVVEAAPEIEQQQTSAMEAQVEEVSVAESSTPAQQLEVVETYEDTTSSNTEEDIASVQADPVVEEVESSTQETPTEPEEVEEGYHIVQPKENLYRISLKYNVKMDKLLDWNNINDASDIKIGTKLRVKEPKADE
ncbi:type IV pilus biogenesis/stability protein PilW [Glaciecola sp. 1036]|uniref:type IV pilus biogenesis/stability protein PilW n=1 Tax=Alteromonadaceae TaxID=72275 RepID=UPI003D05C4AE